MLVLPGITEPYAASATTDVAFTTHVQVGLRFGLLDDAAEGSPGEDDGDAQIDAGASDAWRTVRRTPLWTPRPMREPTGRSGTSTRNAPSHG
jgi:hypothetical protein